MFAPGPPTVTQLSLTAVSFPGPRKLAFRNLTPTPVPITRGEGSPPFPLQTEPKEPSCDCRSDLGAPRACLSRRPAAFQTDFLFEVDLSHPTPGISTLTSCTKAQLSTLGFECELILPPGSQCLGCGDPRGPCPVVGAKLDSG